MTDASASQSTPAEIGLADFQQLIRRMYFEKDIARGVDGTFMWLIEEVGELAASLRGGTTDEQMGEFADVLAWLATIANVAGVDLAAAVQKKYGGGCPGCGAWSAPATTRKNHEPNPVRLARRRWGWVLSIARPRAHEVPTIIDFTLGIHGNYKLGRWCQIGVTLASNHDATVEIELVDGDGQPFIVNTTKPELGRSNTVYAYAKPGRAGVLRLAVRIEESPAFPEGRLLASRTFAATALSEPLPSDTELILVVGPPIGIDAALALDTGNRRRRQIVSLTDVDQLPLHAKAYDAFDRVVIHAGTRGGSPWIDDSRLAAVRDWVAGGGRAVVTVGAAGEPWLGEQGLLKAFAPGKFAGLGELRDIGPLETYSQPVGAKAADRRADISATGAEPFRLPIARLENVQGIVEAKTGEGIPLVVQSPLGFGEVRFVAFDLDAPGLANWSGRPRFIRRLLDLDLTASDAEGANQIEPAWRVGGYRDLGEQLRHALDQFDEARALAFWAIVGLALVYIALVGPIDYFFVRGRTHWTWMSSAAVIGVVTFAAFWVRGDFGGGTPRAKALHLIDVDLAQDDEPGRGFVRGVTWTGLRAAQSERFAISAPAEPKGAGLKQVAEPRFSSVGAPASWHGTLIVGSAAEPYRVQAGGVTNLGLAAHSSKLLELDWTGKATDIVDGMLSVDPLGKPVGKIINPLAEPLTDAVLFYSTIAYSLGTLAPKEAIEIGPRRQAVSAATVLNRQRIVEERETIARYDPSSLDTDRILEMILFHEAAGGASYTKLKNEVYARLDMSNQLRLGRAVLFGRTQSLTDKDWPAVQTERDEIVAVEGRTVYRFVLPVAR